MLFAIALAIATSRIEYAFASDPLGPRAFPYIIAGLLGSGGLWYFLSPGEAEAWPPRDTLMRAILLIVVTAVMLTLLDKVGFVVVALVLASLCAWLFGATLVASLGIGAAQAAFWFVVFKYLLGTYLPAGTWLFPV